MGSKLKWILSLNVLAFACVLSGCGGGGSTPTPQPPPSPASPTSANLDVFMKDAAADNVLAFRINVNSISVTDSAGKTTIVSSTPQQFELRHLELAPTLAAQAASLASGTYNTMTVTLGSPQLTVNTGGAISQVTPQLANSTVSIPLNSFNLPGGGLGGITLDFDLQNSISVNAGTYTVNPVIRASMSTSANPPFNAGIVDTVGKIMALPSSPANSFDIQVGSVPSAARVITSGSTVFDGGITQFSNLAVGQFVEVEAQLQTDGTFMAKTVAMSASNQSLKFEGIVTGVQQDASGNVTALNIVAQN